MPRAFSRIAYTPSVRRAQERYGSRADNAGFDTDPQARDRVTPQERAFIENADTFFMASVGQTGWPYVQHRGGPRGFLKVLDERTIGFADFAGNRQYISAGNLDHDDRVVLILMDFARRARLKIWGRARVVDEGEEPALLARLEAPSYPARVERAYVITVEAFDFNCPQHITQRFSQQELVQMASDPEGRLMLGRALGLAPAAAPPSASAQIGDGPLELVVSGLRQHTATVRVYTLRRVGGATLPAISPGAKLALPVRLPGEAGAVRRYSIAVTMTGEWEVAVPLGGEAGASAALQRDYQLGTMLGCASPAAVSPGARTDGRDS